MRESLSGRVHRPSTHVVQRAPFPGFVTRSDDMDQLYGAFSKALAVHKATVMAVAVNRIIETSNISKRVEDLICR